MASHSDIHALIDPNLRNRIDKTKFITCTFEAANAGLDAILGDVVEELKRWIDGSALGVACELHWTVPEKYRSRMHECRLKEAVHRVLRENNRAVLRVEDESHGLKASEDRLAESNTRENQRRNPRNDSFEGVYQRCYTHLLPYCHRDTAHWHHPYWSWHSLDRNQPLMPRAELFSSTGADPHHSSILALHIVSLRLRRPRAKVKVVDIDDNPPEFVENKHQIFRVDLSSFNGTKKIGKLLAVDKDERPNDRFTYHLIPECNPRLKTLLKVDQKTGDLSLSGEIPVNVQDLEIFCALVSPIDHPDLNALAFDSQNASMTRLQVKFLKDDHEKAMALKFYPNNTILTIDPDLVNLKFPLISPYHIPDGITFERGNVDFEPALYASPMSSNWSSSIFSIDSQTGALRVSPLIITVNDQGIFKISVNAIDKKTRQPIAQFTQNVHLIDDEEKLKFVFEMGPAELAYNGERLLRKLADALISEDPEKEIDIVGDKIEKYPGEKMRSSICVHAAKDGRLLSRNDLLGIVSSALQKSTSSLQNLYHIFKVINVESCDTVSYQRPLESANPLSQSFMLMLCVICVVLLFVWALFAYYCFVHRYRLYLDEKQRAAQGLDKKSYPSSTLPPPPIPPHYLPNLPPIY
ncbi:unnamed protein product, partial [Mesorhabditis belari]|uniref:Cadherin domain-containing protein n=1 Tax=Mesorhabditis belari TaxID=2138241 RepID=A0AAF3FNH9_9BILA